MGIIKKYSLVFLVALSALSVSASAAFYSITGLSKLFAGASLEVMIMATALEVSKLVIASLLYQYWLDINKLLRTYLSAALVILVFITSMGIYGFLSSAYQQTATKAHIIDKQVAVLELKKKRYEENREYNLAEKNNISESITSLRKGLSNNQIKYRDRVTGELITTTSSKNRDALQGQLNEALESRDKVSEKLEMLNDSISSIEIKILEIENESDVAAELGPLEYLSGLTGKSMDVIINVLLLVIIFVFDPLAISLVIAANYLIKKTSEKNKDTNQEKDDKNSDDGNNEDGMESFLKGDSEQEVEKEDEIDEEEVIEIEQSVQQSLPQNENKKEKKKILKRLLSRIRGLKS